MYWLEHILNWNNSQPISTIYDDLHVSLPLPFSTPTPPMSFFQINILVLERLYSSPNCFHAKDKHSLKILSNQKDQIMGEMWC